MPFGGLLSLGIGAGSSLLQGLLGSHAANSAAQQQQQAAQQAGNMATDAASKGQSLVGDATKSSLGLLGNVFAGETSNLNPYLAAGQQGVTSLASAFAPGGNLATQFSGPNPQDISSTPEYQFQLGQGVQAIDRSASAAGALNNGGTLKSLTQYGQGLASTAYQQAYNNALNTFQTNHNNTLGGLLALSGIGQNATGQFNAASQNYGDIGANTYMTGANSQANLGTWGAQMAGQDLIGGANAAAQGTVNSANTWNQAIGGLANSGLNYIGGRQQQATGSLGNILNTNLDKSGYFGRTSGMRIG